MFNFGRGRKKHSCFSPSFSFAFFLGRLLATQPPTSFVTFALTQDAAFNIGLSYHFMRKKSRKWR